MTHISPLPAAYSPSTVPDIPLVIHEQFGRAYADHGSLTVTSAFQPVFSPAHRAAIGYEAFLRARDEAGDEVPPLEVFGYSEDFAELAHLDQLSCTLHVRNFELDPLASGWLFVNMNLDVFVASMRAGSFFPALFANSKLSARQVVIELLEESSQTDRGAVMAAVDFCRELGCLIAFDDFGLRHASLDRVWRIRPDIVKFDRLLTERAVTHSDTLRIMRSLTGMLHDAGALVLMTGIESKAEADIAMASEIDLLQGFYFAHPSAAMQERESYVELFNEMWSRYRQMPKGPPYTSAIQPPLSAEATAMDKVARQLAAGQQWVVCANDLMRLPGAKRCYVLDANGHQLGTAINARDVMLDSRFAQFETMADVNWSRAPFVRQALADIDRMSVSSPHRSLSGAGMIFSTARCTERAGARFVICVDYVWPAPLAVAQHADLRAAA